MIDYARPYIAFVIAAGFLLFGAVFQTLLPLQFGLMLTEVLCVFGVGFAYQKLQNDRPEEYRSFRIQDQRVSTLLVIAAGGIFVGLMANVTAAITIELFPALKTVEAAYAETIEKLLRPDELYLAVAGVIAVTVFAPVCEEFLFRGTLLPAQLRNEKIVMAVIANGLLFGAFHMNPMSFVPLSIVGMFLAHITIYTRSLWPAILAHATLNLSNGVILPLIALEYVDPEVSPPLSELFYALCFVMPIGGMLWMFAIRRMKADWSG